MVNGLIQLDREASLELLRGAAVGRIAVIDGGTPTILPVNFVLDGDAVVFRTDPGLKLQAGPRSQVSFEVDDIDPRTRSGWSVVVTGHLDEVTRFDRRTWDRITALPVDPWAGGEKAHWMRLLPARITGRRIAEHAEQPAS